MKRLKVCPRLLRLVSGSEAAVALRLHSGNFLIGVGRGTSPILFDPSRVSVAKVEY